MLLTGQIALLIAAAIAVGTLHTMVPDHWLPIALLARRHGWTKTQTARTAAFAGLGHTISTLAIATLVWAAGAVLAKRFGDAVTVASSVALIAFGAWIAIGSWREIARGDAHEHHHPGTEQRQRTALLLILGSSPMVEGIPAFFAASRFGIGLLIVMAIAFAASTIVTYVALSVASSSGIQRLKLGRFEVYGEVISGSFIALLGLLFLFWPAP
jgi:hypothetical protein